MIPAPITTASGPVLAWEDLGMMEDVHLFGFGAHQPDTPRGCQTGTGRRKRGRDGATRVNTGNDRVRRIKESGKAGWN
jgi:hypothetical protein